MKNISKILLLLILFTGCDDDQPTPPLLRIKNVDTIDFEEVLVGNVEFGALTSGETSDYEMFDEVYRYNYIRIVFNNDTCIAQPIDFVGETAYTSGKYRYDIKRAIFPQFEDCFVEIGFVKE